MTAQLIRVKINLTFNSVQKVYNGNSNIWIKSLTFTFGPFFIPEKIIGPILELGSFCSFGIPNQSLYGWMLAEVVVAVTSMDLSPRDLGSIPAPDYSHS